MREEIRRIHAQTRITTMYVTHDQKESLSLADRMAVMRDGALEQVGDPRTVYRSPTNRFVADFIGETNWLPAEVVKQWQTEMLLATEFGEFHALPNPALAPGAKVWLGFRPEALEIGTHPVNSLDTLIVHVSYLGEIEQYQLRLSPTVALRAIEQNPMEIRPLGARLTVHVYPQNLLVLPA